MNLENFNFRLLDDNLIPHDQPDYRVDRNFEALITERGQSFEDSEVYSRIFLEIKGLISNNTNPEVLEDPESFEKKYLLSNSIKSIDRVKKLIIDINNNKMEAEVLFNYSNTEYTKYVQNILSVIKDIDNSSPEPDSEPDSDSESLSSSSETEINLVFVTNFSSKLGCCCCCCCC